MDGYSVNEAAAVLGIPEGRVWELLARGVLSGSTEVGGDMRVFLRDTALAQTPKREGNGGNGGNGGSAGHGELTPFRELLTEFRNLTERYGQALLALGEARGEVASLRGRVDLLEARIEHRLPWTEASPAAWATAPDTPSDATTEGEADAEPDRPLTAQPPDEPLADAEPGQPPLASDDVMADILGATIGLPPEPEPVVELEPEAEAEPVAELESPTALEPEPDAEPAAELELPAALEPEIEAEPVAELEPTTALELEAEAEPAAELAPEAEAEPATELATEAEAEPATELAPEIEAERAAELESPTALEPEIEAEPAAELAPEAEAEPVAELEPEAEAEPVAELEMPDDLEQAKPKAFPRGRSREAFTGFAEALARAQDPTTESVAADFSELPGSQETADALAAYRRETETDAEESPLESVSEPEIEPAPSPEASEAIETPISIVRPGYSTDTPEPDWIAEEDLIISAGEDASVRADELAHQTATAAVTWSEIEEADAVAPEIAEVEAAEPEAAEPEAVGSADPWPESVHEESVETGPPAFEPVALEAVESEPVAPEPVEPVALAAEAMAAEGEPTDTFVVEPEVAAPGHIGDVPMPASEEAPPLIGSTAPEPAPESQIEIENEPEITPEPEPPAIRESRLTPVDIAVEPPAIDDVALLVEPEPFAEPPIVPPEPAFWESGAGSRAPFAIAQPDPWEPRPVEAMPVEVAAIATPVAPDKPAVPLAQPANATDSTLTAPIIPEPTIEAEPAPVAAESPPVMAESPPVTADAAPVTPEPAPEPPRLSPAAEAGRAAAAAAARRRKRPRGPAARALRRLRYLLD